MSPFVWIWWIFAWSYNWGTNCDGWVRIPLTKLHIRCPQPHQDTCIASIDQYAAIVAPAVRLIVDELAPPTQEEASGAESLNELATIRSCLDSAGEYGLQGEIVWNALLIMKANPDYTVEQAITFGHNEWVK
jgi:hypothetical protein